MIPLPADERAPSLARDALQTAAGPNLDAPGAQIAALLVSEVVTNAVRHGARPIAMRVIWIDGALRVEVRDGSARLPARKATPDANGGFGLVLVDALAHRWGADPAPGGKIVWFELDLQLRAVSQEIERAGDLEHPLNMR
ncbi:MAG TPA: ATP-binding protein [Acidimicrobiales bacterium]|nr:ATP-binding protein [Acidimicrobiales bacterium]